MCDMYRMRMVWRRYVLMAGSNIRRMLLLPGTIRTKFSSINVFVNLVDGEKY